VPEVRCLRKKLDAMSRGGAAEKWAAALSRQWMEADPNGAKLRRIWDDSGLDRPFRDVVVTIWILGRCLGMALDAPLVIDRLS